MKMPLHLLHAVDLSMGSDGENLPPELESWAKRRLQQRCQLLREIGVEAIPHLTMKDGSPDEVMLEAAEEVAAKLIVVAASGKRRSHRGELGSHAERVAQHAATPVLVVRDARPFEAWGRGERPLRVLLGGDPTLSAEAAMRWVRDLKSFGPCKVALAYLYWPPQEFARLGLGGYRSYVDPDPEVHKTLEIEFRERLRHQGLGDVQLILEPHIGRVGDRLAEIAREQNADLLVVGTHTRNAIERWWEGSVSANVVKGAGISVACVPSVREAGWNLVPQIKKVIAATDFSPAGNAAVALAYGVADYGAVVHLVHVVKRTQPLDIFEGKPDPELVKRLQALVPSDALARGRNTEIHVLGASDPAQAIHQAAERLGGDVIALGTRGRTGVAKALLGSTAQALVAHTGRPVLLAHAPNE
jgi:nucleotide-binding universal stress UspA family protein